MQDCQDEGTRLLAPYPLAERGLPAQHVVNEVADGCPVAGTCKAVRDAPILESVGSRPVPKNYLGKNLDCRLGSPGQAHVCDP